MKMKQITLSLAGVLAAIAFAPEASAVPVFARQTGMACSACHFNHFPMLNPFGRAFKASGYTMMGGTEVIEGEDLAIPNRLNMALLATAGHDSLSASANGATPAEGGFFVPGAGGEMNLFIGGRVTESSGFLSEFGLGGAAIGGGSGKLLILPEVAENTHAGLVAYQNGQGPAGSFELLSTGATSIHRLMGKQSIHNMVAGARQYVMPENGATGLSLVVANNDIGYINISKYARVDGGSGVGAAKNLPGTYVRAVGFFNVAGFDSAAGIQNWSGTLNATTDLNGFAPIPVATADEDRATVVDLQMQSDEMGLGIYASYGTAPVKSAAVGNNRANPGGTVSKKSFNVAVDYTVMPKVTIQGAIRKGTEGILGQSDDAIMIGGAYELAMNQHLSLHYTTQSGSAWNNTGVNGGAVGKNATTLLLESFF